jgi:simple sugar transport system substrate-binding protein
VKNRSRRTTLKAALLAAVAWGVTGLALGLPGHAGAAEVKKLAIMTPEDATDFGWNQQGVDAAKAAAAAGARGHASRPASATATSARTLRELADDGASLIIAHASGYQHRGAGDRRRDACAGRHRRLAERAEARHVADYTLSGHEGAYLAGRLAAKMTQTKAGRHRRLGRAALVELAVGRLRPGRQGRPNPTVKILYAVIGPAAYSDAAGGNARHRIGDRAPAPTSSSARATGLSFGMLQAVETGKAPRRQGLVHRRDRRQDQDRQGLPAVLGGLEPGPGLFRR